MTANTAVTCNESSSIEKIAWIKKDCKNTAWHFHFAKDIVNKTHFPSIRRDFILADLYSPCCVPWKKIRLLQMQASYWLTDTCRCSLMFYRGLGLFMAICQYTSLEIFKTLPTSGTEGYEPAMLVDGFNDLATSDLHTEPLLQKSRHHITCSNSSFIIVALILAV